MNKYLEKIATPISAATCSSDDNFSTNNWARKYLWCEDITVNKQGEV